MLSLTKISAAVLALASFVHGTITIQTSTLKGNSTNTINWTSSDSNTDPESFTIELINPSFNSQFGVVNNVPTAQGSATFELPTVIPGPGYSIQFVNPGNITDIIAQTGQFTIVENDVSSSSSSASRASSGSVATGTVVGASSAAATSVAGVTSAQQTTAVATTAQSSGAAGASSTSPASTTSASGAANSTSTGSGSGAAAFGVPVMMLVGGVVVGLL